VATAGDVAGERRGVYGDESALHGLNLDDVEHDGRPLLEMAPLADMHRHVDVALGPGKLRRDGALAALQLQSSFPVVIILALLEPQPSSFAQENSV